MRGLIESMGTNRFILLKKTHFAYAFLHRNMFRVLVSFWVFLSKLIRSFFRFSTSRFLEGSDSNIDDFNEIQSSDHVDEGNRETKSSPMVASTSKYEFLCSTGISGFVEEPETKSFTVHAFFMGSNDYVEAEKTEETNAVFEEKTEECALRFSFFEFEKQIEVIKQEEPVEDYAGRSSVESSVEKQGGDIEGNEHVADVFESIVVDFESPKMVQELGPLKIDEKYDHKHHMGEIQKVYKSYSDKMRKLDILNSQTMHAISLLKLKDVPIQVSTLGKSSAAATNSLHKALSFKQRTAEAEPAMKLIRDLHKEFETVYVGQICLSWAILLWQFGQVKKLLDCDNSLAIHHYNQVAEEFQHFQVLLQRFIEDEPFRTGHRVENYTYSRCSVRHLLQVPVIKDDCSKSKDDAISCEMLKDIIEESLLVFWEFLRADKDEANSTSKALRSQVAPHEPIDFEFLMDVKTHLHKPAPNVFDDGVQSKEKRLKEIQRGTNCIIKKFQRQQHQGNLLDYALFIAQVELKLVSRVLNMSKISTDQLAWCHEKLQRIRFSSRKIEIEPSFTLFPC
ncbi:hypothetical protein GOBAR_AA19110 [Gossypium barbadense]|uniref:Uncharacterized protein n=1 Tax=Gossypium barbadense TaxID=3634 RepID=A0A2P5XDY9_GOSBA|nr:hypothetical protein GOBAR_AA19110 [Gossypium barbadense]